MLERGAGTFRPERLAQSSSGRRRSTQRLAPHRVSGHFARFPASLRLGDPAGLESEIQRASGTSTREGDDSVWVSKINEFIGSSSEGFEDAALEVVERANRTLRGITGIEILDKSVKVQDGEVVEYRVKLRLLFDMAPESDLHW